MEQQYYVISKEYLENLIDKYTERKWDAVENSFNSNIANALVNVSKNSTLVDLSDSAIEVESIGFAADRDKGAGHGYPSFTANLIEKGYCTALINLKNKLNGNN